MEIILLKKENEELTQEVKNLKKDLELQKKQTEFYENLSDKYADMIDKSQRNTLEALTKANKMICEFAKSNNLKESDV